MTATLEKEFREKVGTKYALAVTSGTAALEVALAAMGIGPGDEVIVPAWSWKPQFILTVVGFLGTTISPYLFFWQAGEEVEEEIVEGKADAPGHRTVRPSNEEMRARL